MIRGWCKALSPSTISVAFGFDSSVVHLILKSSCMEGDFFVSLLSPLTQRSGCAVGPSGSLLLSPWSFWFWLNRIVTRGSKGAGGAGGPQPALEKWRYAWTPHLADHMV